MLDGLPTWLGFALAYILGFAIYVVIPYFAIRWAVRRWKRRRELRGHLRRPETACPSCGEMLLVLPGQRVVCTLCGAEVERR